MPIVDHKAVPETPWRPNYHKWDLVGPNQGVSSNLSYSVAEPGTGAPLHYHEDDELIVVLEGTIEVRLGDEVHCVGPDHTVVVPPNVPHSFKCLGPGKTKMLTFFPVPYPFKRTTYLQGDLPAFGGSL